MKSAARSFRVRPARRGLTLLELLLALAVTAMVGTGISSMLSMVSQCATSDQDRRSALLRTHAAQVRLRSYVNPALNILAYDEDQGLAIWLHDDRPEDNVHLTELRVIWFDSVEGTLSVERVHFPDGWSQSMKDQADEVLPSNTNFFNEMLSRRAQGHTAQETIVDEVEDFIGEFNEKEPTDSTRVRFTLRLRSTNDFGQDALLTFGLRNHQKPAF